jgi:hypothetical protein
MIAQLEDVRLKLSAIAEVRDGVLGTQTLALALVAANERSLRERAFADEIAGLREVAAIRQQVVERNLTAEEGATRIKLAQAKRAHDLTIKRLQLESDFLKAQSENLGNLEIDRKSFLTSHNLAQQEIVNKEELYVEWLKKSTEELRKQQLLRDDPQAFGEEQFLASLQSKQQVIAQGTVELMRGFSDGLVNVLGNSLVDALFSQENTMRDKWEALMKDLVSIMIKTFIKAQLASLFASFGTSPAAGFDNGQGTGTKGIFKEGGQVGTGYQASAAHYSKSAQHFSGGGRPAGVPASDTVAAWLTPGEWVTKLASARMYGDQVMGMINEGRINPIALKTLAAASGRTKTRRKATSLASRGYAHGGSVAGGAGGSSGRVNVLNQFDETSLAVIMAGKQGERMVHNHLLNLGVIV